MTLPVPEQVRHDADPRAREGILAQKMRVSLRDAPFAEGSYGIACVVAGHHIEQQGRIPYGSCDRADLVLRLAVRDHAAPTDQAARRAYAHQAVGGRGRADRRAGSAAGTEQGEVGGYRRTGATA